MAATLEQILMQRIAKGDRDAFDQIVQLYYQPGSSYLLRLLGRGQDMDDILQESFIKIWTQAKRYDSARPFKPWFYKVVYHQFIDHCRRRKKEPLPLLQEPTDIVDIEEEQVLAQASALVEQFVSLLPPTERSIFVLFYYQQLKAKAIAEIVGKSEQAVQSILYRLRKLLKTKLAGGFDGH